METHPDKPVDAGTWELQCRALRQAQETAEAELARYAELYDFSPVGYFALDRQGAIARVNLTGAVLLGTDRTALVSQPLARFVPEGDRPAFAALLERAFGNQGREACELTLLPTGQASIFARLEAQLARDGRECLLVVTDISQRWRAEEELARATRAVQAAHRTKSEFLANMSHEIRTPMTSILGFADLLLMSRPSPREQQDFLEEIWSNGKALLELIDDILDYARLEAEQVGLSNVECSLQQILDDVTSLVAGRAAEKGLALKIDCAYPLPERIRTDPVRLAQILKNLAGNAVKFTARGGVQLRIRCRQDGAAAALMEFAVSDTGLGIRPDKLRELFQPFTQADASLTRRHGGTGLGLAISKRLAQALGGDIQVASQIGQGSTFTLTVRVGLLEGAALLEAPPTPAEKAEEALPWEQGRPLGGRVLLAEDVPAIQHLVAEVLRQMNVRCEVAGDGRRACAMAEQSQAEGRPYDLILMDIQMPEMNGYDAVQWLRQHGWAGPIVALTAHAVIGDRERCLKVGCNDYLAKPMTAQKLGNTLARFLGTPRKPAGTQIG